jgi:biopolymer transport protein ExbB/TolQ
LIDFQFKIFIVQVFMSWNIWISVIFNCIVYTAVIRKRHWQLRTRLWLVNWRKRLVTAVVYVTQHLATVYGFCMIHTISSDHIAV